MHAKVHFKGLIPSGIVRDLYRSSIDTRYPKWRRCCWFEATTHDTLCFSTCGVTGKNQKSDGQRSRGGKNIFAVEYFEFAELSFWNSILNL
ncbi:MAG: hypothetical protein DWI22_10810 [Planctomycetota bacterium]|nr:MAG: hypothetical protein DWI22_10810 [Planctomycetota bacterium]